MPFEPQFADLARNAASVSGSGPVTLGAAIPGYRSIAEALSVGNRFYYCLANAEHPDEREVGRGTLLAGGQVAREPIDGAAMAFSDGAKTIALVTAAEWYQRIDAATKPASAAEIRAGSEPARAIAPAPLFAAAAPVTLAHAAVIRPDFGAGINFDLTLSGDALLDGPVGAKPGQSGRIRVSQDAVGGRNLKFGPAWQFAGGAPALSADPRASDVIAFFVGASGAVEASIAKALEVRPVPLSVSDFRHGLYSLGGQAAALSDLWLPHPTVGFVPGSIIPGEGWKTSSNTLTLNTMQTAPAHVAALGAALASGLTLVADYQLTQPSTTKPRIVLSVESEPDFAMGWHFYQNGSTYIWLYDYGSVSLQTEVPAAMGDQKVAVTLADSIIQYSRGGGAVMTAPGDPQSGPPNSLSISCYTSHDSTGAPAVALLRRLAIYPKQPAAALAALAAAGI